MQNRNFPERILAHFKYESGEKIGSPFDLPIDITKDKLESLCNHYLGNADPVPGSFYINDNEILNDLKSTLDDTINFESVLEILYLPQSVFRVSPVTRCSSSIPGHAEAVVSASFDCWGSCIGSGSGDTTVRIWDVHTETPLHVCKGHKHWVLCIAWSPCGTKFASGCKQGTVIVWNPKTGQQIGSAMRKHREWITCLSWEPLHLNADCRRLVSSSKDCTINIWDTVLSQCLITLSSHTKCVTCVKWGGSGLVYSASQDTTIKVWRPDDGVLCRTITGHAHWVNILALNTDYVMRTGAYNPVVGITCIEDRSELQKIALKRYQDTLKGDPELMVSGSDDFTLYLWTPTTDKKPITRMTGHQQLINDVKFSPNGRLVASASFDKSIKLWNGFTGTFITTFRGHVQSVYQISWSADSRLLVSGSADSTLKVWSIAKRGLEMDLPGHADEVYAVDWSPDGERVVSGGKDKVLKIWRR